jgi:hypothetical protein
VNPICQSLVIDGNLKRLHPKHRLSLVWNRCQILFFVLKSGVGSSYTALNGW